MDRAMTPEQITAGCLYQCAVLRVYGPWQTCEVLAAAERQPPPPPALVEFNSRPASVN